MNLAVRGGPRNSRGVDLILSSVDEIRNAA